eukprot:21233-Heterococcus_DN1.PRE.6
MPVHCKAVSVCVTKRQHQSIRESYECRLEAGTVTCDAMVQLVALMAFIFTTALQRCDSVLRCS